MMGAAVEGSKVGLALFTRAPDEPAGHALCQT